MNSFPTRLNPNQKILDAKNRIVIKAALVPDSNFKNGTVNINTQKIQDKMIRLKPRIRLLFMLQGYELNEYCDPKY